MKRINEAEAAEILKSKDNILILTHRSPDGDTLGCAFALRRVLSGMGKTVMVDCSDDIPKKYSYMWGGVGGKLQSAKEYGFFSRFCVGG